ncbi:MAG: alpha-L-fucosidase [Candidatus Aminicenantes bacterium]|nr:alpha-L-fucosidase [Candidatus Aminicenantes bacterium]
MNIKFIKLFNKKIGIVPTKFVGQVILVTIIISIPWACSKKPNGLSEIKAPPEVTLLAENKVRLSNDPNKTEIFRDAGLGLFIHWGPNSQLATEISWPLNHASEDYIEKYYALAETFNPKQFNAQEWAKLARLAGMEYVVFTAKHHDGFCMFDTAYSDFKITNTPYGQDITALIAEAFRQQGLLVGFYYSPGDFRYGYETGQHSDRLMSPQFDSPLPFGPLQKSFLNYEQGQIEELLTKYGDIFMLWFDGQCDPLKKHAWRLKQDLFIGRGEIPTPEQEIPGLASDYAWESCMTTSWQWSYSANPDILDVEDVIKNLIRIRARGGNMLLNIGPRPDGTISPPDEAILRELGQWMSLFGEAVQGVRPWVKTNEGDVWLIKKRGENTVYALADPEYGLEDIESPLGCRIILKSVHTSPETTISVLSQKGGVEWNEDDQGLHITVSRTQTIQIVRLPEPLKVHPQFSNRTYSWGPAWPIAIKITHVQPAS